MRASTSRVRAGFALLLAAANMAGNSDDTSAARVSQMVAAISDRSDSAPLRAAIVRRLDELTVEYRAEDFCFESVCGTNVVVESRRPGAKTLMLGAHYDGVAKGKGAVDDAPAVAAVLELLATFRNKPLRNLVLTAAFFDSKEAGRLGSSAYVASRRQRKELPEQYLNFDLFAYGDVLWALCDDESSPMARAIRTAAYQQKVALTMEGYAPPGDDQIFREAGVEAVGLGLIRHTDLALIHKRARGDQVTDKSSLMRTAQTAEDTPEKVNGEQVVRAVRVVEAAIRAIDAGR